MRKLKISVIYNQLKWNLSKAIGISFYKIAINNSSVGLFAHMSWLIAIINRFDKNDTKFLVEFTGSNYNHRKGEDWLSKIFISNDDRTVSEAYFCAKINTKNPVYLDIKTPLDLGLIEANALLKKYFKLSSAVDREWKEFVSLHQINSKTLAIHYRGTDKKIEADAVSYETMMISVNDIIRNDSSSFENVFISTDEERFIEYAIKNLNGLPVIYRQDSVRSNNDKPIHTSALKSDNTNKAIDAVINSLIISSCGSVIRTTSFLSAWSSVFNPSLKVYLVNTPFSDKTWFPERAIIAQTATSTLN